MGKKRITNADFVHLHNHTEYSSFDGLNKVSEFPKVAADKGFRALAMTDHGNIGGALKFMKECFSAGIKPLVGEEFYLARDRNIHFSYKKDKKGNIIEKGQTDGRKGNRHLVLLAKNWIGYQNLCRLSQVSWTEGYYGDPRIDFELLEKYSEGLICSSACLSSVVNANLLYDRYDQAKKSASMFKDIFGDDFYLEVMYHGIDAEGEIIPDIIQLANEIDCYAVATNDCHYAEKEQGKSQELLMAMSASRCLNDPKHIHFPHDEFYLKSAREMAKTFGTKPELLLNTNLVAEKIDSHDIMDNLTGRMRLPKFDIPKKFKNPHDYLEHLAWKGLSELGWDNSQLHIERLRKELNDVKIAWENNKYDFATYFIIVRDYIQVAKQKGILTGAGRGSGFGSVLLMCLGITYGPDPLKFGLLWERFLGFDTKRCVLEQDFGFDNEDKTGNAVSEAKKDELNQAREVSDDLGGIDRY